MNWSYGVITAPRKVDYLTDTLKSLAAGGFPCPTIIADGPAPPKSVIGSHACYASKTRLGCASTLRRAVDELREYGSHVLIFEDDVRIPVNFRHTLEGMLPGDRGVISLYLSEGRTAPDGWSRIDEGEDYPLHVGCCAILMDVETAGQLIDSPPFQKQDGTGSQLAIFCRRNGIPFWVHSPSLVKHVGLVSAREGVA